MKFRIIIEIEQGSAKNSVLLEKHDGKSWKAAKFQGREVQDVKPHEALRIADLLIRDVNEREIIEKNRKLKNKIKRGK